MLGVERLDTTLVTVCVPSAIVVDVTVVTVVTVPMAGTDSTGIENEVEAEAILMRSRPSMAKTLKTAMAQG